MKFKEFKQNVGEWARVRGIYEQSTEAHQQAKALEEVGEYLTAENDDERADAIGDIAVCIVNAAFFDRHEDYLNVGGEGETSSIADLAKSVLDQRYNRSLGCLNLISGRFGLGFGECLDAAWNEIKDRKGMMIEGKYVKWESMSDEQRKEFTLRDSGNTLIRS